MFKTATLDYKYLHTDFPRYFGPYLACSSFSHNTKCSQSSYCEVTPFNFSHNKSSTQFYFSFAFEAPKLGNDLPDDVHGATFVFDFIGTRWRLTSSQKFMCHSLTIIPVCPLVPLCFVIGLTIRYTPIVIFCLTVYQLIESKCYVYIRSD